MPSLPRHGPNRTVPSRCSLEALPTREKKRARDDRRPVTAVQRPKLPRPGPATACVEPTPCRGRRTACGEEYGLGGVLLGRAEEERDEVAEDDDGLTVGELGLPDEMRAGPAGLV